METTGSLLPKNQGNFLDFQKRAKEASPTPLSPSYAPVSVAEYASISLNILKYLWKCLNKLFCNHFYIILRLFDVLPSFLFTTSETMRDYYLYIQVASRVAERLKEIRKYQESV